MASGFSDVEQLLNTSERYSKLRDTIACAESFLKDSSWFTITDNKSDIMSIDSLRFIAKIRSMVDAKANLDLLHTPGASVNSFPAPSRDSMISSMHIIHPKLSIESDTKPYLSPLDCVLTCQQFKDMIFGDDLFIVGVRIQPERESLILPFMYEMNAILGYIDQNRDFIQ